MALELITPPTVEPVTVDDVKNHLHLDHDDEDVYIGLLIRAARGYAETRLRRQLVTATWKLHLDCFPCGCIDVPVPPLVSVTTLTYIDAGGATVTLAENTHFVKDVYREPGRVYPAYNQTWPSTRYFPNSVALTFVAGYGDPADVPSEIKYGILLLVAEMFDKREPTVTGATVAAVPQISTLLDSCSWGSYA